MKIYYLFLSIVTVIGFGLCYRIGSIMKCKGPWMLTMMFFWSTVFAVFYGKFEITSGMPVSVYGLALPFGLFFALAALAFFPVQKRTRLGLSWTVMSLALAVPAVFSILIWKEKASFTQIAGLVLVVAAITIIGAGKYGKAKDVPKEKKFGVAEGVLLAISFFLTAGTMIIISAFDRYKLADYSMEFMVMAYLMAGAASVPFALSSKAKVHRFDVVIGAVMAFFNVSSIHYTIVALRHFEGMKALFFPVRNGLNIILMLLVSFIAFKEKISRMELAGVLTAIAAIYLLFQNG